MSEFNPGAQVVTGLEVETKPLVATLAAVILGLIVLFGVALASSDTIHNAAHDTRHAAAFPCH